MLRLQSLSRGNPFGIRFPPPPRRSWQSFIAIGLSVWLSACGVRDGLDTILPTSASPMTPVATLAPTSPKIGEVPESVKNAVLADLSQSTGQPVSRFKVEQVAPHTWPDGCLGLAAPDRFCTQALVPGWRVTVTDGTRSWVYRTNATGSQLKPEP